MENTKDSIPSITSILNKISDDKTLTLFNSIAVCSGDKYIPLKEMNLTTKQYYSRISGLLSVGLIRRDKGKYSLTLLGKAVYFSQMTICKALTFYWKLKAIESVEANASVTSGLPDGERMELINALINNHEIKEILIKTTLTKITSVSSSESRSTVTEIPPPIKQAKTI